MQQKNILFYGGDLLWQSGNNERKNDLALIDTNLSLN